MSSEESCQQPADKPLPPPASDAEEADTEQQQQSKIHRRRSKTTETAKGKGKTGKATLEEKLSSRMFSYARETICFFLAVAFSALAVLHSAPPRVSKPPLARPLFNESSLVLDFYKGHLSALVDRVTDSDFSFVMYYAPWDAESQALREEFESVARYYHSQVFFAAINCWQPGSECRARYSKIQSYPVLMLYPAKESGVQYKGVKRAAYMIRFIHTFMNPIKRVSSDRELMHVLKSHDAVMIGYFRFHGLRGSPGYAEFYRAALRSLEREPNGEVAFVAVTSPHTAREHGVERFPSASLLMWNETMFYPDDKPWQADQLTNWIGGLVHRVVTWLQPPGIKSSTLAPYLWDGPVLFLFTPRNPLHHENDNYNLLREVALQYYDCSANPQIQNLVSLLRESRVTAALWAYEKRERCVTLLEEKSRRAPLGDFTFAGLKQHQRQQRWSNATANCCSDTPTNKCVMCTRSRENGDEVAADEQLAEVCAAPGTAACHGRDVFSVPLSLEHFAYVDKRKNAVAREDICSTDSCSKPDDDSTTSTRDDPRSSVSVRRSREREDCRRFLAGYSYHRPIYPRDNDTEELEPLNSELICRMNKTLALVAIDSLQYYHFAEGLGIDVTRTRDKTAVVVIDPADESQYVMEEVYGRNALARFINNYTSGYLRRAMRSSMPRRFVRSFGDKCKADDQSRICLPELTSENFLETVLDPRKDVVVMYHSPYCAFCSAVAYVFLTAAHYLGKMDHLEFVRVDGDNNDLPWEYTMNRYPSVLFFPAKRKEDSTLFPLDLQITIGNLLSFVLANLDEESHMEALINMCAVGAGGSPENCLSRARWLCLDILEDHLRDFRRLRRFRTDEESTKRLLDTRRRVLLLRLELVREVHLLLGTSANLVKERVKVRALRKKFKRFYAKLANLEGERDRLFSARYKSTEKALSS